MRILCQFVVLRAKLKAGDATLISMDDPDLPPSRFEQLRAVDKEIARLEEELRDHP